MVGILQVNGFGEESTLTQDLKPFRILISLLDKPELGNTSDQGHEITCGCFILFNDKNNAELLLRKIAVF